MMMYPEKLKVQMRYRAHDKDTDKYHYPIFCEAKVIRKERVRLSETVLVEFSVKPYEELEADWYSVVLQHDHEGMENFFCNEESCFHIDIDFFYGNEKIGWSRLNRVFVYNFEDTGEWLNNNAPDSMEICTQICRNDFEVVEGRYVGIIDSMIMDKRFIEKGLYEHLIYITYALIHSWKFDIYYLYTQPKSLNNVKYINGIMSDDCLNAYRKIGFDIVDKEKLIMRKDLWHEIKNRKFISSIVKDTYFP